MKGTLSAQTMRSVKAEHVGPTVCANRSVRFKSAACFYVGMCVQYNGSPEQNMSSACGSRSFRFATKTSYCSLFCSYSYPNNLYILLSLNVAYIKLHKLN